MASRCPPPHPLRPGSDSPTALGPTLGPQPHCPDSRRPRGSVCPCVTRHGSLRLEAGPGPREPCSCLVH